MLLQAGGEGERGLGQDPMRSRRSQILFQVLEAEIFVKSLSIEREHQGLVGSDAIVA